VAARCGVNSEAPRRGRLLRCLLKLELELRMRPRSAPVVRDRLWRRLRASSCADCCWWVLGRGRLGMGACMNGGSCGGCDASYGSTWSRAARDRLRWLTWVSAPWQGVRGLNFFCENRAEKTSAGSQKKRLQLGSSNIHSAKARSDQRQASESFLQRFRLDVHLLSLFLSHRLLVLFQDRVGSTYGVYLLLLRTSLFSPYFLHRANVGHLPVIV
jgi:hypothetical protein